MTSDGSRDIASWRREYEDRGLGDNSLGKDPIAAFRLWIEEARIAGVHEPNAMVVSTVGPDHAPSSRVVLLKTVDDRGFVFYTNYQSSKGAQLDADPACALLFPWNELERQVRIEGHAEKVSPEQSDAYFRTRPRGSQIGAWASPQSTVVPDREFLQGRYQQESDRFATYDEVPRPPHWGGYLVRPQAIEFWQGRPGRMHDRIRFQRVEEAVWSTERLAP